MNKKNTKKAPQCGAVVLRGEDPGGSGSEVKGLYDQICKFESQLQYREFSIIIIKLL